MDSNLSVTQKNREINWGSFIMNAIQKWWFILIFVVVFGLAGLIVSSINQQPSYTSTSRLAVINKSREENSTLTQSDIQASQALAKTCQIVLTSDQVVKGVAKWVIWPNISSTRLSEVAKISVLSSTNFIEISVTTDDPARAFDIANALRATLPDAIKEFARAEKVLIVNDPTKPTQPDRDRRSNLLTIIGVLAGFAVSILILIIKEYFNDTVKSINDIHDQLKLRVIGTLPNISEDNFSTKLRRGFKKKKKNSLMVTDDQSGNFTFIENIKGIRTKLEAVSERKNYKVFVFTSTLANEGKTTVACNFALSLAQKGKSVLLIDSDLRRPSIHQFFALKNPSEKGFVGVLAGNLPWSKAVQYNAKYKINVLLSGKSTEQSSELISLPVTKEFLDEAREEYDYIIIDTPPSHILTDAAVLTEWADAVVMVIKQNEAHIDEITTTIDSLTQRNAKLLGCILNRTRVFEGIGYGRKYYKKYYRY